MMWNFLNPVLTGLPCAPLAGEMWARPAGGGLGPLSHPSPLHSTFKPLPILQEPHVSLGLVAPGQLSSPGCSSAMEGHTGDLLKRTTILVAVHTSQPALTLPQCSVGELRLSDVKNGR